MELHPDTLFGPAPERAGRLVFLNGTPSAGKTTVAKALQEELAEPFFHLSLDELRGGYPRRYWRQDHGGVLFRRVSARSGPRHLYEGEGRRSTSSPAPPASSV
ncbi:zeta toxin family protein [Nonomuraea sp. NPDC049480]|uniref:phosphotransferase-like protein n=1 Tax=Nonomuraea sp. NPDC049480 TaxID=3364353 RepID=UPI003795B009